MTAKRPVWEKRLGQIRVAIWENKSDSGATWFNVSLVRRVKDGEEWKEYSTYNGLADLAIVKQAVELAISWIVCHSDDASGALTDY